MRCKYYIFSQLWATLYSFNGVSDFVCEYYTLQLHDSVARFEQEKFDMQKRHTLNIQELLDDTNNRLQKMEEEYGQQMKTTVSVDSN